MRRRLWKRWTKRPTAHEQIDLSLKFSLEAYAASILDEQRISSVLFVSAQKSPSSNGATREPKIIQIDQQQLRRGLVDTAQSTSTLRAQYRLAS